MNLKRENIKSHLTLLFRKINTSSINLALPINLCHPASNYSNFSVMNLKRENIKSHLTLLFRKINTSSINLALPINLCHPASNYSNFSAPHPPPPAEKTCLPHLVSLTQMNLSYFKTTGQDTHTVKIQHGKME